MTARLDYEALLAGLPDAVVGVDEGLRIVLWNPAAEALLGPSAPPVLRRALRRVPGGPAQRGQPRQPDHRDAAGPRPSRDLAPGAPQSPPAPRARCAPLPGDGGAARRADHQTLRPEPAPDPRRRGSDAAGLSQRGAGRARGDGRGGAGHAHPAAPAEAAPPHRAPGGEVGPPSWEWAGSSWLTMKMASGGSSSGASGAPATTSPR